MTRFYTILLSGTVLFLLHSCYYDKGDKLYPNPAPCDTVTMTYTNNIKPIIQTNCLDKGCHTTANPSGSIKLEVYNEVSAVASANKLSNAVNYSAGGSKNMPPTAKLASCEIAKIDAWIKRGYPEN